MKHGDLVAFLFLLLSLSEAKTFKRCELAQILKKAGLDRYSGFQLGDWICMTYYESKFNTKALKGPDKYNSISYGLFQINSRWWCTRGTGKPKSGCSTYCKSFMNRDISDDIECVKKIVANPVRMEGWGGWKKHCKGKDLSRWTRNCVL